MEAQVYRANSSALSKPQQSIIACAMRPTCNCHCLTRVPVSHKEFKNEATKATRTATTVEAIRTEFPIFQALSTPSSPQFQQLDNESSRDDLRSHQKVDLLDEIGSLSKPALTTLAHWDEHTDHQQSVVVAEEKYLEKGE